VKETAARFAQATYPSELESVTSGKRSARCQTRSKLRYRLLIFALAAFGWCDSVFADLNFVQLTDPHIFDGEAKGEMGVNREALKWSIEEINRRQDDGKDDQCVVVTGDLGLEGLADYLNPEKQQSEIVRAARELAGFLKPSKVKKWLFLPGNNDLVQEDPGTIGIYRDFMRTLIAELPEKEIVDFSVKDFLDFSQGEATYRFIGFDNASFKANEASIDAECFDAIRQRELQRVAGRVQDTKGFAYIFYHIPEIDDPYYASHLPDDLERKARANSRGQFGKDFPLSAWTVTPAVRNEWNRIVTNDKVKARFAGHFHSSDRKDYAELRHLDSARYPAAEKGKLFVCPPLASKKQEKKTPQARGFRPVTLGVDGVVASAEIVWLNEPSPSPSPSPSPTLSSSGSPTPKSSATGCRKNEKTEPRRDRDDIHRVISDIESVVKSVAILCGIIGGFWTWLAYMRRRPTDASANLEQYVRHWTEGEATTLHVVLQVHNIGKVPIQGDAFTEIEELTTAARDRAAAAPAESRGLEPCVVAPGEIAELYFDIPVSSNSRRFRVNSKLIARYARGSAWRQRTWSVQTIYEI
jgi:hypothetical protein